MNTYNSQEFEQENQFLEGLEPFEHFPQQNAEDTILPATNDFNLPIDAIDIDICFDKDLGESLVNIHDFTPEISQDQRGIILNSIINELTFSYDFGNDDVFYYDYSKQVFIYCGTTLNLPQNTIIPFQALQLKFGSNKTMLIKIKSSINRPKTLSVCNYSEPQSILMKDDISYSNIKSQQTPSQSDSNCLLFSQPSVQDNQNVKYKRVCQKSTEDEEFITFMDEQGLCQLYQDQRQNTEPPKHQLKLKQKLARTDISKNQLRGKLTERLIGEVLELIKQWRKVHNSGGHSLTSAAKQVGAPKKSLDDYLRVCKRAMKANFKFENHLMQKFGFVRAFVRNLNTKEQQEEKLSEKDGFECVDEETSSSEVPKTTVRYKGIKKVKP